MYKESMMILNSLLGIQVNISWDIRKANLVVIIEGPNKKCKRVFIEIPATFLVLKMVVVPLILASKNDLMYLIWLHKSNTNKRIIKLLNRSNKTLLPRSNKKKVPNIVAVKEKSLTLI